MSDPVDPFVDYKNLTWNNAKIRVASVHGFSPHICYVAQSAYREKYRTVVGGISPEDAAMNLVQMWYDRLTRDRRGSWNVGGEQKKGVL
jgi:hypothetical protein